MINSPPDAKRLDKCQNDEINFVGLLIAVAIAIVAGLSAAAIFADNLIGWSTELKSILFVSLFAGFALPFIFRWFRLSFLQGLVLTIIAIYLASGSGYGLIGVFGFWIACFGIGIGLASLLFGRDSGSIAAPTALVLGYAVVACILALLSLTCFNFSVVYLVLFGGLCILGFRTGGGITAIKPYFRQAHCRSTLDLPTLFAQSLFCTTLFILCIASLLPETSSDAVAAYRPIITELIETGGFVYDPKTSVIRLQPLLALWPQSFAAILTSDAAAAKALNFSTIFAAAMLLYGWTANRFNDFAAAMASACLLATPILFMTSVSAFLDNALIFLVTGLLITTHALTRLSRLSESGEEIYAAPAWKAGIVLGLISVVLIMSKMTAMLLVPAIALYILVIHKRFYNAAQLAILITSLTATALLIYGPFLLFVYLKTGSPVFPYFNEIFQSPYYPTKNFNSPHQGYFDFWLFWDMMVNTSQYASRDGLSASSNRDGQLGVISVLLLFSLLSLFADIRKREKHVSAPTLSVSSAFIQWSISSGGLALLCAVIGIISISLVQSNSRYILPVLPFIGIALAAAFYALSSSRWGRWIMVMPGAAMVLASLSVFPQYGYNPSIFAGVWQPNHDEIILDRSSIQIASARMSELYGNSGRVLFDHRDGGFEGQSLIRGWYDFGTKNAYQKALAEGGVGLAGFLKSINADAFVMTDRTINRTTSAGNYSIIQDLEQLARSKEVIGGTYVFTLPYNIAFDMANSVNVPRPEKSGALVHVTGARTVQMTINYACTGSGSIYLFGNKKILKQTAKNGDTFLCDGQKRQLSLRLNELDSSRKVTSRVFVNKLEFTEFEGVLYLRE